METETKKKFDFNFFKKIKNFKHFKTIVVSVLIVIVLLIFISSFSSKKTVSVNNETKTSLSSLEYSKQQENRLESILSGVKGISNVRVYVMVDESPEIVYLENKTTSANGEGNITSQTTTSVMVKNGQVTTPVVVKEILPKIKGVLIVAKGGGDLKMKTTLTNIVASVLTVNISNVEVLEGK